MKGFKAFKKGLICDPTGKNPFQYAENTVFEQTDEPTICKSGFHFCKNPLDVLEYYPLIDDNGNLTEFAEVEALAETKTDDNKKYCTKKLKIGAKLSLPQFIKASFEVTYENIENEVAEETKKIKSNGNGATLAGGDYATLAGSYKAKLAGGDYATLAGGDYATLAGSYKATLAGGDYATLAGGDCATLAGGNEVTLAGGNEATLAGGDGAKLAGGNYATLAGGNGAKLAGGNEATLAGGDGAKLAGGNYATLAGGNGAKLAGGNGAKLAGGNYATLAGGYKATLAGGEKSLIVGDSGSVAKGKKGTVILLVERNKCGDIISYKAEQIDGATLREDTFYRLKNGEFVEVDSE